MLWVDAASWLLLLGGSFFLLTGSLGMVRLPDVFTRMHAAGMTDTMGAGLILAGLGVQALGDSMHLVAFRLALVLAFVWFTSPIATHAVAKAALAGGVAPYARPEADGPDGAAASGAATPGGPASGPPPAGGSGAAEGGVPS